MEVIQELYKLPSNEILECKTTGNHFFAGLGDVSDGTIILMERDDAIAAIRANRVKYYGRTSFVVENH